MIRLLCVAVAILGFGSIAPAGEWETFRTSLTAPAISQPRTVVIPPGYHQHADGRIHSDANVGNADAHAGLALPWKKTAVAGDTVTVADPAAPAAGSWEQRTRTVTRLVKQCTYDALGNVKSCRSVPVTEQVTESVWIPAPIPVLELTATVLSPTQYDVSLAAASADSGRTYLLPGRERRAERRANRGGRFFGGILRGRMAGGCPGGCP